MSAPIVVDVPGLAGVNLTGWTEEECSREYVVIRVREKGSEHDGRLLNMDAGFLTALHDLLGKLIAQRGGK